MSMSSGLMRRSLDRASLMILMALQGRNKPGLCSATRWHHKHVAGIFFYFVLHCEQEYSCFTTTDYIKSQ